MAVRHGYGKVAGTDALVFAYDTGDTKNSFKGEPTTNLSTITLSQMGTDGSGQGSVGTRTILSPNHVRIVDINSNTRQSQLIQGLTGGTTYTISVEFKKLSGTPTFRFQIQDYNGGTYLRTIKFTNTAETGITDKEGWQLASWTFTLGADANAVRIWYQDGADYTTYTHSFELRNPQLEAKSHPTPYTPPSTTRSATQGLQDITKSSKAKFVKINGNRYPVIEDANGRWVKVFGHYNANGSILFTSVAEATLTNEDNPSANKFSILGRIEHLRRRDGKFKFKLEYPEQPSRTNIWYQTSNPTSQTIAGYEAISIGYSGNYWGGLEYYGDATTDTFINGSVNHPNWYFAIGSFSAWSGAIPGPGVPVNYVNVYLSLEDTLLGDGGIDLSNVSFDSNGKMTFDGSNDYIALTGNILNVDSFTIEAVVNITSDGNYNKPIFVAGDLSTTGIWFFKHRSGLGNRLVMHGYDGVNPRIDVDSVNQVPDAVDTYVAVTFDGNAYQLYMNGEPEDSPVVDNKVGATTTNYIGKQGGTYLDGDIPMMKIYNRALTAKEIKSNYNAIKGRFNI